MSNHISIAATPQFQPWNGELVPSVLTAKVWDSYTDEPVPNITVTFVIGLTHDQPRKRSVRTDHFGIAKTTVDFTKLPETHNSIIPISASIPSDCAELDLFFYNKNLLPLYITNLNNGNIIDEKSLRAGVQVIILPLPDGSIGDVYQLFWGKNKAERAFNGANFPWVADIKQLFGIREPFSNGNHRVSYKVIDAAGNTAFSQPVDVKVCLNEVHKPTLIAPLLLPDCLYGVINLPAAIAGIEVSIPGDQPEISDEDHYKIYLDTETFDGTSLNHILIAQGKVNYQLGTTAKILLKDLQGYNGVNGDFYYLIFNDRDEIIYRSWLTRTIIDTAPRSR